MLAAVLFCASGASAIYANSSTPIASQLSATPKPTQAPIEPSASSSNDLTTYVTVVRGKTLTVTTHGAKATPVPSSSVVPVAGPAPASSNDLTTYVTVVLGKTMTVTTHTAQADATGVYLANGVNAPAGFAAPLAALAGAAAVLL